MGPEPEGSTAAVRGQDLDCGEEGRMGEVKDSPGCGRSNRQGEGREQNPWRQSCLT